MHNADPDGLFGFIRSAAMETPTAGLSLLGRLIPVSMVGTLDGKIVVVHRDETMAGSVTENNPSPAIRETPQEKEPKPVGHTDGSGENP
jgi:hypothetical protein